MPSQNNSINETLTTKSPQAMDIESIPATSMPPPSIKPYSVFTHAQRRILTAILGLASIASPLSANVYLPLLPVLRTSYHVSEQAVNLTITLYVVVSALAPALFAPTADTHGRRPVALASYAVFTIASLALGLNDHVSRNYVALILLRALSAFGAAACASITYGVVSDVCIPAERGTMVGPAVSAANVGTVLGPVVGGLIAWATGGAEWVFLLLAIFGAVNLTMMVFLLPETARMVVGDGSEGKRARLSGWRATIILGPQWGQAPKAGSRMETKCGKKTAETKPATKKKFAFPNTFQCLAFIFSKDTALVLWLAGCNYAVWYCITAAIPQIYSEVYGWSELDVGLAYLPSALTIFACGFVTGPWNNYKYRKTAREEGVSPDSHHVDGFPIEKARTRQLWPAFFATHALIASFGWSVQLRAHPAVSLVLQAAGGFVQSTLFFAFNTLLIDTHPDRPSTASAAASLIRSGLSGVGVAVLQPLVSAVGWGWYTTLCVFSSPNTCFYSLSVY